MNQFMGVMTDPFIAGRGDPISGGGNPNAYAEEEHWPMPPSASRTMRWPRSTPRRRRSRRVRAALERVGGRLSAARRRPTAIAVLGSNDTRSSIYGGAAGADYRISPNTLAASRWPAAAPISASTALARGRSDLFQAGAFIRHNVGAAYITGALAYGWQDVTTDRTVTVAGIDGCARSSTPSVVGPPRRRLSLRRATALA